MNPLKTFRNRILFVSLLILIGLFYAQKIYFVNGDLGRHIKNGEVFLERCRPISTNYYSYTEPGLPAINHHWGTGVIFYFIWKWFGFQGLSVLNLSLYLSAFLFFFKTAEKKSNFNYAFFFSLLIIPLIASRTEVRPEGFSFFFMGLYYYLLYLFRKNKISFKKLLIIIPLQTLWVNLHIFFIMGPFLVGVFWLDSLLNEKYRRLIKQYTILIVAALSVCLINPFGLKGALVPFMILREYGYMIAENQSLLFMQSRFPGNPLYYHFEAIFLITAVSFALIFLKKQKRQFIPQLIIMLVFSALSWKSIRGIPVFGFFFIPVASGNTFEIVRNWPYKPRRFTQHTAIIISAIIILAGFCSRNHYYSPFKKLTGLGLCPKVNLSADFFKDSEIRGPIFNNYDIGGYLIFHLFPEQRVFVDNRPEAYSVSFFKDIYEPMQRDEKKWSNIDQRYDFNCIYFYRHDITPYAQPFLINRINEHKWAPVFVDDYIIILLKRNKKNETTIKKYELPKSIFRVSR